MGIRGFLGGQVPATHTHLGQGFPAGNGISLLQAPHLAQAKVPGRSLPSASDNCCQIPWLSYLQIANTILPR